ncbi:MAG: LacI family DNA-binding transcriptional regulator [Clostridia bacterium]|nr:LacI family DNA-binding transcriptional regulator [Clostridia bacterium]
MSTIKDIAAEAGVSVMTVSNVIHNNYARVSPATAQRVREIMARHQYVPNMAARSLISKFSHIIAVLLPVWHGSAASMLLDPYTGQLVGYLEELLREKQYYVMVCSFQQADEVLTLQQTWQMDGMILVLPHKDAITRDLIQRAQAPLVVFDRYYEDLPMLSVCLNDRLGGYTATRYLLEKGHRKIGFAAPTIYESSVIQDRFQGYLSALSEYHLQTKKDWLFDGVVHQEGGEAVAQALSQMSDRPTAIVATEDLLACGILKGCQERGMQVPEDMSVVGFDDSMPAQLITPRLTTIAQDIRQKAATGVQQLFHAMEDATYRNAHAVLDIRLVERQSVWDIRHAGAGADS